MVMNRKGQAAVADAIYFLMVVGILSSLLFFFSTGHGTLVSQQLALEYRSEYATSALKTMLYSSTPRVLGTSLEDATEVDFLLAAVKEDYADNGEFDVVKPAIVNNVMAVMEPVADTFDYIYYIYIINTEEFAFFMLYTSNFDLPKDTGSGSARTEVKGVERAIYLCNPTTLNKADPLITGVGRLYQTGSRMQLVKIKPGQSGYQDFDAHVNFAMWVSTDLPDVKPVPGSSNTSPNILDSDYLNCGGKCYKKLVPKSGSCDPRKEVCNEWKDC